MKKLLISIFTFPVAFFTLSIILKTSAFALSWEYPNYDVTITIEENSKFNVEESATFIYNGELNGMRRDITLYSDEKASYCAENPDVTCGGFEFLTFKNLEVNGKKLDEADFKLYEVTPEESSSRYFRIEKRLHNPAKNVFDEEDTWTFDYDVYGGIQEKENESGDLVPYFYWNLLPEDRGGETEESTIKIVFPETVDFDESKFIIYGFESYEYDQEFDASENAVTVTFEGIDSYGYVTASYEFAEDELIPTGSLDYEFITPSLGGDIYIDDNKLQTLQNDTISNFPSGDYEIKFDRFGYEPLIKNVVIEPRKTEVIKVELSKTPLFAVVYLLTQAEVAAGVILSPVLAYAAYSLYRRKGRDHDAPKTIIPKYTPPENAKPYLLGSLADEKVDNRDITGSIIDLAYSGFLKIKEIKKGKNYELTRTNKEKETELDVHEANLMDALFGSKDIVETSDFTYTGFVTKLNTLKKAVEIEMVTRGYFTRLPSTTRGIYLGIGIVGIVAGVGSLIFLSMVITGLIGELSIFTPGMALTIFSFIVLVASSHMPSKTSAGSKVYADILGFKMYLQTAERFRLKDLTPDEFERYLSYAITLQVEKDWAKSFKDIYNKQPDWYQGSSPLTNAYLLSSFSRSFSSATESKINSLSSSSGKGGGWSGGGSFGGFSGGGGGGGSSGGW